MNVLTVRLPESGRTVNVEIERKTMKSGRLRVYPDGRVRFSVPRHTSGEWAGRFLVEKAGWLEGQLDRFAAAPGAVADQVRDGGSVQWLGQQLPLSVTQSGKPFARREGGWLVLGCPPGGNLTALLEGWQRQEGLAVMEEAVARFYPLVAPYGVAMPQIKVRKMKSRWGSCAVKGGAVTFSLSLLRVGQDCVDYVALHELAHFLHPNHGKEFHGFLTSHMPDWKARRRRLNGR